MNIAPLISVEDVKAIIRSNGPPEEVLQWILYYADQAISNSEVTKSFMDIKDTISSADNHHKYALLIKWIDVTLNIVGGDISQTAPMAPSAAILAPSKNPDDPKHIIKHMHLYTNTEILESMKKYPDMYSAGVVKDLLGYYLPGRGTNIHELSNSLVIIGMILNVPKVIIQNLRKDVGLLDIVEKHYNKYETDEFIRDEMLIDFALVCTFSENTPVRDYIIAELGYERVAALGSKCSLLPKKQIEYFNLFKNDM
jgi:hypothetical protein